MTARRPSQFLLTGIFLLGMAVCYALIILGRNQLPHMLTYNVTVIAPVFGAMLAGLFWRRRSGAAPVWSSRRPVSWTMTCTLVLLYVLASVMLGIFILDTDQTTWREAVQVFIEVIGIYLQEYALPKLLIGFFWLFLVSLIQIEAGLFLGTRLQDGFLRRSAEAP